MLKFDNTPADEEARKAYVDSGTNFLEKFGPQLGWKLYWTLLDPSKAFIMFRLVPYSVLTLSDALSHGEQFIDVYDLRAFLQDAAREYAENGFNFAPTENSARQLIKVLECIQAILERRRFTKRFELKLRDKEDSFGEFIEAMIAATRTYSMKDNEQNKKEDAMNAREKRKAKAGAGARAHEKGKNRSAEANFRGRDLGVSKTL
ncbi:hypothetical protein MMC21_008295 [Puttea exsequens]|nr:hypothetical protein [Puttea exsequens]